MAEAYTETQNIPANTSPITLALQQQEPGCGEPETASPVPCDHNKTANSKSPNLRILRLPEVMERVGLCRASIYGHMNLGSFPKPISLGTHAVGWLEHEIDAWLAVKIRDRKEGHKN